MTRWASDPLRHVRVASPCDQDWDAMRGEGRVRFCTKCELSVYDLSAMTRDEAESLLATHEGRLCARFYRRRDGTILTADCPVGWRALERRVSAVAVASLSFLLGAVSGTLANAVFGERVVEEAAPPPRPTLPVAAPPAKPPRHGCESPRVEETDGEFTLWGGAIAPIPPLALGLRRRKLRKIRCPGENGETLHVQAPLWGSFGAPKR